MVVGTYDILIRRLCTTSVHTPLVVSVYAYHNSFLLCSPKRSLPRIGRSVFSYRHTHTTFLSSLSVPAHLDGRSGNPTGHSSPKCQNKRSVRTEKNKKRRNPSWRSVSPTYAFAGLLYLHRLAANPTPKQRYVNVRVSLCGVCMYTSVVIQIVFVLLGNPLPRPPHVASAFAAIAMTSACCYRTASACLHTHTHNVYSTYGCTYITDCCLRIVHTNVTPLPAKW